MCGGLWLHTSGLLKDQSNGFFTLSGVQYKLYHHPEAAGVGFLFMTQESKLDW